MALPSYRKQNHVKREEFLSSRIFQGEKKEIAPFFEARDMNGMMRRWEKKSTKIKYEWREKKKM